VAQNWPPEVVGIVALYELHKKDRFFTIPLIHIKVTISDFLNTFHQKKVHKGWLLRKMLEVRKCLRIGCLKKVYYLITFFKI
jgi:hypothetical protein